MTEQQTKPAGVNISFPTGYSIVKAASVWTSKERMEQVKAECADDETWQVEAKKRVIRFTLKNWQAVPVDVIWKAIIKSVVIDIQSDLRKTMTDSDIAETDDLVIDLVEFYGNRTTRKADSLAQGKKLVAKMTPEQAAQLVAEMREKGLIS